MGLTLMSEAPAGSHRDHAPTIDEQAGHCFGCGPANPEGLHLVFTLGAEDGLPIATARVNLTRLHEGPPGHIHGGIIATLMDEAMSKLNRPLGVIAMTRHMEVDYLRPSPLHCELVLTARHVRREGRKLFHEAELKLPDGTVLAQAKGIFIVLDPALIAAAKEQGLGTRD
jgi:uncharacterized protein (TIGR00369 family)